MEIKLEKEEGYYILEMDEAMEELVRGREYANKLGQVLLLAVNHDDDELAMAATPLLFAQHLLNNILNSFTNTLILLKKNHQMQLKRDFSFITPTKSHEDNSQDTSTLAGRGSYKRRKTTETWEKISESPIDDGHQWRKYGQKTILNSKYSRDYYRCTHKLDQRCEATKQVQRVEEKPASYKTTYYGHHTCKNTDEIIFEPTTPSHTNSSSVFLSFNNAYPTPNKQDCPFLSSHHLVLDCKEEEVVIPSPSEDELLSSPLDSTSTLSSSTKLESDDDDHKDMMMMMYGLLYDSVDQLDHHDRSFHPFLGLL
ncbi:unnamed protein product [Trifolium pratense]|uniref:Uncharacterized protein n=1 Tax=Trifolium pratense TaxID=57577 RepID=A0ACB0L7I6_TRIPR|nr:unnamed protein product [Trifolium pratense]